MKKFLTKIIAFFSVFIMIVLIGVFIPNKTDHQSLHYAIYDKHKLLEETKSKRIILVGGSNLSFGIYSPMIAETFGINVINTGLHAGYGLKFIIDDVSQFIKEGDIIIIAPEYQLYYSSIYDSSIALLWLIDAYPAASKIISLKQWYSQMRYFHKLAFDKIKTFVISLLKPNTISKKNVVYERKSFNEFGDITAHWDKNKIKFKSIAISGNFNTKSVDYILKFKSLIEKKGGYLFLTYPCLSETSFKKNQAKINIVKKYLNNTNLQILGDPFKYSFPDNLFFNTQSH